MSDVSTGTADIGQIFKPATVALMILIGVVGFFGALVLGAYAPELDGQGKPGGNALSNSAIGYSGVVRLAAATGRNPQILRDEGGWAGEELVIATPEEAATKLNKILAARTARKATLYVLPKWDAVEHDRHKGWVQVRGLLPVTEPEGVLAPGIKFAIKRHAKPVSGLSYMDILPRSVRFTPPDKLQVIAPFDEKGQAGPRATVKPVDRRQQEGRASSASASNYLGQTYNDIYPLIEDGSGGIVLGQVGNLYILADPDLLDNAGMKHSDNAGAALALLDWLNVPNAKSIGFDVVLDGIGSSKSLLRLMFEPPILAMTLTLAVMALLLGIRAAGRFGAPGQPVRAIAFGKTALVENGAMLVRKAGKARRLGGRYAAMIRDQAVRALGVSARLSEPEVDRYLDTLGGSVPFTALAQAAELANGESQMLAAARALYVWKQEVVRDY